MLSITVHGGENSTINLLPRAIVLMIRGSQHTYLTGPGETRYLPTTSNWTGYCIALGDYKLVIKPNIIGSLVAPDNWSITINITGVPKIVWVDTDELLEERTANLVVANTAGKAYTVEFYIKNRGEYKPIMGYDVPGGRTLKLKVIVGRGYKGVYYEKGADRAEGSFEFSAHRPGETVKITIPRSSQASQRTTTTTATKQASSASGTPTGEPNLGYTGTRSPAKTAGDGKTLAIAVAGGAGAVALALIIILAVKR